MLTVESVGFVARDRWVYPNNSQSISTDEAVSPLDESDQVLGDITMNLQRLLAKIMRNQLRVMPTDLPNLQLFSNYLKSLVDT